LQQVYKSTTEEQVTTLKKSRFHLGNKNHLVGHYYRTLYQLLKLVATKHPGSNIGLECSLQSLISEPVTNEEKFYSNLARSVLSYEVTQLLAINCYSEDDSFIKFKQLVIKYQLLEHMPLKVKGKYNDILIETIDYYGKPAFGNSQFLKLYSVV
jgi:hypothetical protein